VRKVNSTSSTFQPYFSWLSVYGELGAVGFALSLFLCIYLVINVKRHVRSPAQRLSAASFGAGVLFIFLLGMQDNYWEVSQGIFVGLILLKVQYASLIYTQC